MTLENIKFRMLDNGWTVKYHVAESQAPESRRFGGEIYVKDLAELEEEVIKLIRTHNYVSKPVAFAEE